MGFVIPIELLRGRWLIMIERVIASWVWKHIEFEMVHYIHTHNNLKIRSFHQQSIESFFSFLLLGTNLIVSVCLPRLRICNTDFNIFPMSLLISCAKHCFQIQAVLKWVRCMFLTTYTHTQILQVYCNGIFNKKKQKIENGDVSCQFQTLLNIF